jgi:hypothetical protein
LFWGFFFAISATGRTQGTAFELQVIRPLENAEEVLFRVGTEPLKTFRIQYIHSWDKCPIIEVFRIEKNGTVTLEEEIYGWFGAGLEFNPPTGFTDVGDGMVHIRNIQRNLPALPIRVGWISGFRLEYENVLIPLDSLVPPGTLVSIRIFPRFVP